MCTTHKCTAYGHLLQTCRRLFSRQDKVPPELLRAFNDCAILPQLIDLLFSIDYTMDEATIAAFDQRIDELEQSSVANVYYGFDQNLKTRKSN